MKQGHTFHNLKTGSVQLWQTWKIYRTLKSHFQALEKLWNLISVGKVFKCYHIRC